MDRALLIRQLLHLIAFDLQHGTEPGSRPLEIRRHWRLEITEANPDLGVRFQDANTAFRILTGTSPYPYVITGEPAVLEDPPMDRHQPQEEYTRNSRCPWCGEHLRDLWEYSEGEHDLDCGYCERPLTLDVQVCVTRCLRPVLAEEPHDPDSKEENHA